MADPIKNEDDIKDDVNKDGTDVNKDGAINDIKDGTEDDSVVSVLKEVLTVLKKIELNSKPLDKIVNDAYTDITDN